MIIFNPNSSEHISALLFGGCIIRKKTLVQLSQLCKPLKDEKTNKKGFYSTDIKKLKILFNQLDENTDAYKILDLLFKVKQLNTLITRYYEGFKDVLYPKYYVHAQYSHVGTETGRLSCSKPNLQNLPEGNKIVKDHFVSRFEDGIIINSDYKGIEPRCEAQLSGDENCIKDIVNGIDPHTKNLALKLNLEYKTVEKRVETGELSNDRRKIKGFTFSLQYGAGDKTTAKNSGLDILEVQQLKLKRQKEYPRLHLYYQWLKSIVQKQGYYKDPWGRKYHFKKYNNTYSPTEIQNYRTQGFATGTIIPTMLGIFWRQKALFNRDKYLLINTVHDSVVLDCKKEFVEIAKKHLQILETVSIISKEYFNYEFKVPIECDISVGKSWGDC